MSDIDEYPRITVRVIVSIDNERKYIFEHVEDRKLMALITDMNPDKSGSLYARYTESY